MSVPIPQELIPLICSFSTQPTLASICLSSTAFYLDAMVPLYLRITLTDSDQVGCLLSRARHRLKLTKHLTLVIPKFKLNSPTEWHELFSIIPKESNLISLRINSPSNEKPSRPKFLAEVLPLLFIPSLEYVAIATSVVYASTAIQCRALKELEVEEPLHWDERILADLTVAPFTRRPQLNSLYIGFPDISLPIVQILFDLSDLKRLAIHHSAKLVFQQLEMSHWTLEVLYLPWTATGDITYLRELSFPSLKTLFVEFSHEFWPRCDALVSTMVSICGPRFRELRIRQSVFWTLTNLNRKELNLPNFNPQIQIIRLFLWDLNSPNTLPATRAKADNILRCHFSTVSDFQVAWLTTRNYLTHFGELQEVRLK
ncbi:hypothetical protein DL96DRAFT_1609779 [Flagelloscypha sp. PMI_526]|nr:hypothetical protein DL96DRAFT_1609779 [Flagelloscypha sp. PMI_526]